tara:strand:- start:213 stop:476 length:264 start_codon:yes stop_codon:yes gene_type:complete
MIKELKIFCFIVTIFAFFFSISKYYVSDAYEKKIFRSLNLFDQKIEKYSENLNILLNDTNNIVEYVETQNNSKKKKYHFWKLFENDS